MINALLIQLVLLALYTKSAECALPPEPARAIPSDLQSALENALAELDMDFSRRLDLVNKIDAFFDATSDRSSNEIWLKARFVEAVANMRLNRLDLSSKQTSELQSQLQFSPICYPELQFRCRSLSATLALARGERAVSLRAFEELLSGDVEGIPSAVIDRARTNYAMTLYENGLCKEATELYESIMFDALEHQNDRAALHAGYKLLCMLISHEEAPAARHALDELKPIMARNQKLIETHFVNLSEMDLLRLEGKG